MTIGILAPKASTLKCPGTCLFDPPALDQTDAQSGWKRDKNRPELILQPQPSNSPDDPLNWSRVKKEVLYASLLLGAVVVGVVGPMLVPDFSSILIQFDLTFNQVVALNGLLVLTYGVSSFLCVTLSEIVGRRPAYLLSNILLLVGIVWGATAKSYKSLLGARCLQGFGMGAYGCLGSTTITDVFFLHDHALRISLWQLAFNGCIAICPIISGVLIQRIGWHSAFYCLLGLEIVALTTNFLFLPETQFRRNAGDLEPVVPSAEMVSVASDKLENEDQKKSPVTDLTYVAHVLVRPDSPPLLTSYWKSLSPWKPINMNRKALRMALWRPALTLVSPVVLYAALLFMTTFTWSVQLSSVYSYIYTRPPYNFDTAQTGYITGVSPFIGVMIALLSSGPISDYSARSLSRRNNGFFEPEFRLVLALPCMICIAIGGFGMGLAIETGQSYINTAVFLAFLTAGAAYGTVCAISYASSAYPARGGDTFGIIMLLKALYAWSGTLYVGTWYVEKGPINWFSVNAGISIATCILAIPMWIWGKKVRAWSAGSSLGWVFV